MKVRINKMLVRVILAVSVLRNFCEKKILNAIQAHKTMATVMTISSTIAIKMRRAGIGRFLWQNELVEAFLKNLSPAATSRLREKKITIDDDRGCISIWYC